MNVAKARKFGTFGGVFTPSILSILGVIMFLRLPWIVGQAGLWSTLGIILVAHIISLSTGLSVASIATDKKVGTGGSYYIISRSLGLPIGGTVGLALFVGLSFSISLYLIGFSETFLSYFGFEVSLLSIRIAGSIALFLLAIVTFISTSLAIKTQYLIMGAMVLSLVSIFMGSHSFAPDQPLLFPMGGSLPWITLFAIFFPAVTGFQAGVSMSGDLRDPRKQIPLGTISAILVGLTVYVALAVFFSLTVDRGLLVGDPQVLFMTSWIPQLVIAGILGATLSSALGSILAAPRILQAVSMDRILPGFFAKGYGPSSEPRNALLLAYLIAQSGILIGELNAIARIVSIFFIITYGFQNITYTVESWAGDDFRPSFKIPRIVSIIGALACIIVMIQLDVIALIVASVVLIGLFLFLKKRELTLQTGDTWNSIWASLVKTGLGRLTASSRRANNWRPNVILFSGGEINRPYLIEMGKSLVGKLGIFTNFELIEDPGTDTPFRKTIEPETGIQQGKAGVFTRYHECRDVYEGINTISRIYGFSGFEPNTVLMGWARNTRSPEKFAGLLKNFRKQDLNAVFLSYDKTNGFGKFRTIDFWWSGKGRNLSLATTLLRFITSSKEWRGATIRILTVNQDSAMTESLYSLIHQVLDNQRLHAQVKVINNGVEQIPEAEIIHAESRNTDLCLLELPDPGKQDPARLIERYNGLTASLGTSLLISASSFFDEISVKQPGKEKPGSPLQDAAHEKPSPGILSRLQTSEREIIANEVHNIGRAAEAITAKFYETSYQAMLEKSDETCSELDFLTGKMLNLLARAMELKKPAERSKALLRLLNDFSFHSQKHMQLYKEQLIASQRESLEKATSDYLTEMKRFLGELPEKLWIKRTRREFRIHKDDRLASRLYKMRKMLVSGLTGKPVSQRIKLLPAVRYFVYHKRLDLISSQMNELSLHSFRQVAEVKKVLTSVHEAIEKARIGTKDPARYSEAIRLEKDRLNAKVQVMRDGNRQFHYQSGYGLYDALLEDLNGLSKHLESTRANLLSRNLSVYFREEEKLSDRILSFPEVWEKNLGLFINKALLDFSVLSLQSRIGSKIRKYNHDFAVSIESTLLKELRSYTELLQDDKIEGGEKGRRFEKLDHSRLAIPQLNELYEDLFDEVRDLMRELPEKLEIGGNDFAENIGQTSFTEAEPVVVNFRKALSLYVGSEFIDPAIRKTLETEQQFMKIIITVRDLVRLMNFSLTAEEGIDDEATKQEKEEQMKALVVNFTQKVQEQETKILQVVADLEKRFNVFLKAAFEPLSSATIGKTSMELKKRRRETHGLRIFSEINTRMQKANEMVRHQFVNLLYRRSEGLIWFRHFEKPALSERLSNKDTLDFMEAITPSQAVLKDLPFYYCTLFSGQAGIGDDFWVGMKPQIREADQAIQRFKAGSPGALIVTGARSSGKSSLSKMMARKYFTTENIHQVRAPQGCTADLSLFTSKLLEALNAHNTSVDDVFRALPSDKTIIIQDLGLWWERRPGGNTVIEHIKTLIDRYGHKCLFILTANSHALQLIEHWSQLKSYALATILCEPFDARELKEMILIRHHAGGMTLNLNKKDEDRMSAWDHAKLFSQLFDSSFGNPGTAITLWLANIKKVSGKTIYMESIDMPSRDVFDKLSRDQWFYIMQFVIHRRFSIDRLARNIEQTEEQVYAGIRELVRAGILVEKFQGIYAIRPGLDLYLTDKLKTLNRL
jgi:amino acid transporter